MKPVSVHVFSTLEDAESLWRQAEATGDLKIYQSYDWLSRWYRHVGAGSGIEPCLIAICDSEDQPLILLPLAIERRLLWRALVWLGNDFFDYHAPIIMPDAGTALREYGGFEAVWRAVRRQLTGVDYADFERQPISIGGQVNPFADLSAQPCTQAAHHTELFGDWSSYYASKRSGRTRKNDRRKRKRLEGLGNLEFVVARDDAKADHLIEALLEQKQAYAQAIGKDNLLSQPGYAELLRHLAKVGLRDGSVMLCGLELDGKPLAVQWGAVQEKHLYSMFASYNRAEHSNLSPGDHLLHELMRWGFDNGIDVIDFTYGDEPYKMDWCEHHSQLQRSLISMSAWGAFSVYPRQWEMRLRRWAKSQEWVLTAYARTRKLVHGI